MSEADSAANGTSDELTEPPFDTTGWLAHRPPRWLPRAVVVTTLILFGLYTLWWILGSLSSLLVIILCALFVGFALEPAVSWLARRGMRRGAATLLLYVVLLVAFGLFLWAFGALLIDQIVSIAQSLPDLIDSLAEWLKESFNLDLQTEASKLAGSLGTLGGSVATTALQVGATIVSSLFSVFTIALFGYYIASQGPSLRRNVCSLLPPRSQYEVLRVWEIAVTKTGGYIYSRFLLAGASAICTGAFLWIIKVPNAFTLGLFVGLISQFVPTVGTYIAGALPVLVALTISPGKALLVVIFIAAYQQFENYVLSPPLSSRTMEIHPAVAFGAVIAGTSLLGAVGALIALPAVATIQAVVGAYIQRRELVDSPLLEDKAGLSAKHKEPRPAAASAGSETADDASE